MDAIIVGFLSLVGSLIATFAGIMTANKLSNYRIQQLEKKVDTHNSVIDRTYQLEKKTALIEKDQCDIKDDIAEIKEILKEQAS